VSLTLRVPGTISMPIVLLMISWRLDVDISGAAYPRPFAATPLKLVATDLDGSLRLRNDGSEILKFKTLDSSY
jgi:hypothetical protein